MNTGPEQLKDWMHRRRFMQREAADYLGYHETYVSHLLSGNRTPSLDNAVQIERMTGIPIEAWVTSELDNLTTASTLASRKANKTKA